MAQPNAACTEARVDERDRGQMDASTQSNVPEADGTPSDTLVLDRTREWLEKAVIGLNLCPFARAEHLNRRIRYRVSASEDTASLLAELEEELRHLAGTERSQCETTLIIHPRVLGDFFDFNLFQSEVALCVQRSGLEGVLQVASFHPHFRFAGTEPDDITNFTNRAPYPTLHLLREESIAAAAGPEESERIVERNLETLQRLGPEGWKALGIHTPSMGPPGGEP